MHERPELHHIVLQRCSREQKPSFGVESEKGLPALGLEVFDVLGFIEDHVVPFLAAEGEVILDDELVGSDADVEAVVFAPTLALHFTLLLRAKVSQDLQRGAPALELHLPVDDDSCWDDDQMRAPDASIACERRQQRDGLDCLSEPHLISQDAIQSLVVKSHEPVKADDLVLSEGISEQEWHFCCDAGRV